MDFTGLGGGCWGQQQQWPQQQAAPAVAAPLPDLAAAAPPLAFQQAGFRAGAGGGDDSYIVSTSGNDGNEVVINTLAGEYLEMGSNHGRKVYQKASQMRNPDGVDVFLYYWDGRDGPAFEGWWFGNQVGGTQVWSHCQDHGLSPPSSGWKIPWDGAVRSTLTVVSKAARQRAEFEQRAAFQRAEMEEQAAAQMFKYEGTWVELEAPSSTAQFALEQAGGLAGECLDASSIRQAEQLLMPQVPLLNEATKRLAVAQRGVPPEPLKRFQEIGVKLRSALAAVSGELNRLRAARVKVEREEQQRELEEKDLALFQDIIPEATEKINIAEDAVEKALITAEMISTVVGEDPEEAKMALTETEAAAKEAQTSIGEARVFLNAKMGVAKRFQSEKVRSQANSEFTTLQTKLQTLWTKVNPLKNLRAEIAMKQEADSHVVKVEALMQKLADVAAVFDNDEKLFELPLDKIQEARDETQKTDMEANSALSQARKFFTSRQLEAKSKDVSAEASAHFDQLQTRLATVQADLVRFKKVAATVEQRLAVKRVLDDSGSRIAAAEEKTDKALELINDVGNLTPDQRMMDEQGADAATKAADAAAREASAALKVAQRILETQTRAAGPVKDGVERFRPRVERAQNNLDAAMTSMRANADKLIVDSILLEAAQRLTDAEEKVKKADNDQKPFDRGDELPIEEVAGALASLEEASSQAYQAVAGTKTFLATKRIALKRLPASSGEKALGELDGMQRRLEEEAKRIAVIRKGMAHRRLSTIRREVNGRVIVAERKVLSATEAANKLVAEGEIAPDEMKALCESATTAHREANDEIRAARTRVIARQNDTKSGSTDVSLQGEFTKALEKLTRLQADMDQGKAPLHKRVEALEAAYAKAAVSAGVAIERALRAQAKSSGASPEQLFKVLSKGEQAVSVGGIREFLEASPDNGLSPAQVSIGLGRFEAAGISRLGLGRMLQEYRRCSKEIALTSEFAVKDSTTIRKLSPGDIVEVLDTSEDEAVGIVRVKCRALADGAEGYATLKGNQGTSFFEPTAKPYYSLEQEASLQEAFESEGGAEVRSLLPGEVVELLEGPRREPNSEVQRVMCKAQDNKAGWVAVKNAQGHDNLEPAKLLVCKASIALTDVFDIGAGKAIRKIDIGEVLELLDEMENDETRNLCRGKVKMCKDQMEGWVTIKGNHGKAFLENSEKHFVCKHSVPWSNAVRQLKEGEVVSVFEGPKTETKEGANRAKVRALVDGEEGWITLGMRTVSPWSPNYRCVADSVVHDRLDITHAKLVRKLKPGDALEAVDSPEQEKASGLMRVKVRVEKDGAVGYVTIKGSKGNVFLRNINSQPVPIALAKQQAHAGGH